MPQVPQVSSPLECARIVDAKENSAAVSAPPVSNAVDKTKGCLLNFKEDDKVVGQFVLQRPGSPAGWESMYALFTNARSRC